jgi:NADPH-dependent dioxygenase
MTQADNPRASYQAVADQIGIGMTIGEPQWATQWEILNNIADRYREGRVLICGDASHVHSPAGGQGMNGCMQDAFNLGWKLASVVGGGSDEGVLDTYEQERKPIGEQITLGAKSTHEIVMAFGKGLEDRISITRAPDWQDTTIRLISGLSHNYRDTVRLPEGVSTAAGPKPGERAPDGLLVREPRKRVFDLYRHPHFTLLLVPGVDAVRDLETARSLVNQLQETYPGQVVPRLISREQPSGFDIDGWVADETGEFESAYATGAEGRLILVRPDMYIGLNAPLSDARYVAPYLSQWLRPARVEVGSSA